MKYPLSDKTTNPNFEYLVRDNMKLDYYLYKDFDSALKQAQKMSLSESRHVLIYEKDFNTITREWHGCNTFDVIEGKVVYNKHAKTELHLEFYVNAGDWLNHEEELN